MARPFEGFRARRVEDVEREYRRRLGIGFPTEFEGVAETMQLARDQDKINWLTLLDICDEAISAGFEAAPIPVAIRCTSNRSYVLSFGDCAALLRGLRTWAAGLQGNAFRLKDVALSCASREALAEIDLSEGWP